MDTSQTLSSQNFVWYLILLVCFLIFRITFYHLLCVMPLGTGYTSVEQNRHVSWLHRVYFLMGLKRILYLLKLHLSSMTPFSPGILALWPSSSVLCWLLFLYLLNKWWCSPDCVSTLFVYSTCVRTQSPSLVQISLLSSRLVSLIASWQSFLSHRYIKHEVFNNFYLAHQNSVFLHLHDWHYQLSS